MVAGLLHAGLRTPRPSRRLEVPRLHATYLRPWVPSSVAAAGCGAVAELRQRDGGFGDGVGWEVAELRQQDGPRWRSCGGGM